MSHLQAEQLDNILVEFDRRYQRKKVLNLVISLVVIALGISSVIYIWHHDREGVLTFRWMTVDGTIFTVAMALFFVIINLVEIFKKTEMTRRPVYYARLSSAVAECIIFIVVIVSQLPIFTEHMHIFRYDMMCMHIVIPILMVTSFTLNDSPLGKLHFRELLPGIWFVTIYAAVVIILIQSGRIISDKIPYFFLDFKHMSLFMIVIGFVFIYGLSLLFSFILSELNRKLYWLWFKNLND